MKSVIVDNVEIGAGRPKVIVPIVGKTEEAILKAAREVQETGCDLVEWRIDHYNKVTEAGAVAELSFKVKEAIGRPLLTTFRSFKEGGELDISDDKYFEIYADLIENGTTDLLDVELFMPEAGAKETIANAKAKGIKVVLCNHDFDKTPAGEEIVKRLLAMEEKGADICKIAVMPQSPDDVLTLLSATQEVYKQVEVPLITMSMGALGMVSRVSGEVFGSAATFGSAGQASAPGQVPVKQLQQIIDTLKLD